MNRVIGMIGLVVTLVILLAACGAAAPTPEAAAPSSGELMVMNPWARASAMEGGNSAIYLTLMNGTGNDDTLLSAASDVAEVIELHESKMDENQVMQMSPIPNVPVPAGGAATLEPGGKHIMLIGLKQPLVVGDKFKVTLTFEKGGPMEIEAEVREGAMMSGDMNHDGAGMEHRAE